MATYTKHNIVLIEVVKSRPNPCNISTQYLATSLRATSVLHAFVHPVATCCDIVARNVLHAFGHPVAICCKMLDGVGSSLKLVKSLLQHFWMLQDVARIWPAPSQHLTTRSNNVARCCVEMLRAFGRVSWWETLY